VKSISRPDTLEMAITEPTPLACRCGSAASTARTVCIRSTSKLCRQKSGSGPMASALTLATSTSMPPNRSADAATQAVSASPSATSTAVPATSWPAARSSSSALDTSSAVRAQNATFAPSAANPSTTARPMPLVPPVTRATRPFN
jgi:hypothetical protein